MEVEVLIFVKSGLIVSKLFFAEMGVKPEGCSLDRINNDLGYFTENCRWATKAEQSRNRTTSIKITYNGQTKNLVDWAAELGWSKQGLKKRLNNMELSEALIKKGNDDK